MCLTVRVVYDLPLRQTQGLMRSIAKLMSVEIAVPDFSTLSRRGKGLALSSIRHPTARRAPVHLVVDSTGRKVFAEDKWLENKHKIKVKRKRWRKLHFGLDRHAPASGRVDVSGEIICSDLTKDDVGDPTALLDLLNQIDGPVERFIADGAYDGSPPVTFWRHALARSWRSLSRFPRRQFKACNSTHAPTLIYQRLWFS
jgi:hypothetical protein